MNNTDPSFVIDARTPQPAGSADVQAAPSPASEAAEVGLHRPLLVKTKLSPPSNARTLLERAQLCARVHDALSRQLILVSAPAGYGKTSLLVQTFESLKSLRLAPAWLSLDKEDNDLTHFLSYVVSTLLADHPSFGHGSTALLNSGVYVPPGVLRNTFINDLHAFREPIYLFFDDFHLITAPEVLDLVNTVLNTQLAHVHLLVSSRHMDNLPLSRLRAAGAVEVIEAKDLSFSVDEARNFVSQFGSIGLSSTHAQTLCQRTEGWATGLQMAAIALRSRPDIDHFLSDFSGANRNVADFLIDEVFSSQPPVIQEFLLSTSILNRFNVSLCNAVVGREDSRAMLDELERANLFIFALDTERNWYRFHHLFTQLLRKRLQESHPGLARELHLRASEWSAAHDLGFEAVEHAFAADDVDRAAQLLDQFSARLFALGQTSALTRFTSKLPPRVLERLPRLQLDLAWFMELTWRFDEAREALSLVRAELARRYKGIEDHHQDAERTFLQSELAHREMMLALFLDDVIETRIKAREWLEADRTKEPFMRGSTGTALLLANREQYKCEGTAAAAKTLSEVIRNGGALYGIAFHESVVGSIFFLRGDLDQAESAYESGRRIAKQLHGEGSPLFAMPTVLLAELRYEQGRCDDARRLLDTQHIAADLGFIDKLIAGFITRSRLAVLGGDYHEAARCLEDATYIAAQYGFERLHAHILNERVRQLLCLGHIREAIDLFREVRYRPLLDERLSPGDHTTTKHELLALATARLYLETGRETEAVTLLKQWYGFVTTRRCHRSAIRIGLLLAKAKLALNNRLAAQRLVVEALQMGERGGFVRSFLDEGLPIIELLRHIAQMDPSVQPFSRSYLEALIAAGTGAGDCAEPSPEPPPDLETIEVANISNREIQILNLGARGLPNRDVAATLFLAESTVKWYWQRIFDRLDVRRRSDAIKRARCLGWIQ
ncbi:hypothetical protein G3580_08325 [Nitrogeniibacter mangrovi]|uniref:HTH luxR-type domain-containing protein n=1 Tax=Nitrogeniibacter mangrovi TaxID=2016596 RepID=A0A6C1B4D9_9RHOO|nr:LuxR C-terminal-related transcriptional regulator [Nitrogeniibacter mangrovi]QID17648.1 hypothetical protein G3580_08325 [Nitrogeniibacter mangrovi]